MNSEASGWWWLVALVSGAVGSGVFIYGFRQKDAHSLVFGAALSTAPMAVGVAWLSALIAAGLVICFFATRRFF